jgi:transcriptional regulator with XRE-family HTH domain
MTPVQLTGSGTAPGPGTTALLEAAQQWPSFLAYRDRVQRAKRWQRAADERRFARQDVAVRTGIAVNRLTHIFSGTAIPSTEKIERLDAVLHRGLDVDPMPSCGPAPRSNLRRRTTKNGDVWGARIARSGMFLSKIATESGLRYERARRILRSGAKPTPDEVAALESVLGPADE